MLFKEVLQVMNKVLLATGYEQLDSILRKGLLTHGTGHIKLCEQEVFHRKYVIEIMEETKPNLVIFHDMLPTEEENSEDEWLQLIEKIRVQFDDSVRVVFIAERESNDPFLARLVSANVLDLFPNRTFNIQSFVEQLLEPPKYSRVAKYRRGYVEETPVAEDTSEEEGTAAEEEGRDEEIKESGGWVKIPKIPSFKNKDKSERPVVNKVVEKTVVNKVVNKQVVKRDYNIQITSNVEKVVGVPIEKKLVLVGSPFSRSGSTFFSHLLARELAKMGVSATYVESPYSPPYTYDRFIGHERIPNYRSRFYQYTKEIDPKKPSVHDWIFEDVNMNVKHPEDESIYNVVEVPFDTYVKILMAAHTTITIIDVGMDWYREINKDLYDIATNAYYIIEPDISNIQHLETHDSTQIFRDVLKDEKSALIGNRFDKSILKSDFMKGLYKDNLLATLPVFEAKDVFEAHLKGTFINDVPQYRDVIRSSLQPVLEELLPKEFLKKQKQGKLFKGLFNKKIKIESVD